MKIFILMMFLFISLRGANWRGFVSDFKNELYRAENSAGGLVVKKQLPSVSRVKIENQVNLPVPFAMQAPFSDWSMPYQEACEEAALILASKYFKNEKLDKKIMRDEILSVIDWEKDRFGTFTDTNLLEIKQIAESYFNLKAEISDDVSLENIKKQLSAGNLVLAPAAGRALKNPFYKQPGPIYHVLVVRGYTNKEFIVNDVGIGRGFGYKFDFETMIAAIHDLPSKNGGAIFRPYEEKEISDAERAQKMLAGAKRILIISGVNQN